MAYMNLIEKQDLQFSETLKMKILFYLKNNIFKIKKDSVVGFKEHHKINTANAEKMLFITKKIPLFLSQVNLLYVREEQVNYDIIAFSDEKNPLIIVNLSAIEIHYKENRKHFRSLREAIAYVNIFGFLSVLFGQNCGFECFGKFQSEEYSLIYEYFKSYEYLANSLFQNNKDDFMFYLKSEDPKINMFFMNGKKYIYSIAILFNKEQINISKASKLLDLPEDEVAMFLNEYKGVAYINYLKYQMGERI